MENNNKVTRRIMKAFLIILTIVILNVVSVFNTMNGIHECNEIKGIKTTSYEHGYYEPDGKEAKNLEGLTVTYTGRYYYSINDDIVKLQVSIFGDNYWISPKETRASGYKLNQDQYVSKSELMSNEKHFVVINTLVLAACFSPVLLFFIFTKNYKLIKTLTIISLVAISAAAAVVVAVIIIKIITFMWFLVALGMLLFLVLGNF